MNPTVSIVISTYNRLERLKKAVESVQKQTYTDWELIVVYDGHGDYLNVEDKRVTEMSIDHFGCDTRPKNEGIKASKGRYIALLDDDNTWRPDHLQALVTALEKAPDNVAMVYGDRWIVDERGEIPSQRGIASDFNPPLMMQRNYIDTSDVLIRREALVAVGGFDERYRKYVDWNLWVRLMKYGFDFQRVPLILTDYVLHGDSKSFRQEDERSFSVPAWDPIDLEIQLPYLGEVKEPRVAVFSLTYDRLEYTKACFESLYKTAGYPFDHFVVDNGSTDGTHQWLVEQSKATVIRNESNRGISVASNQALELIAEQGPYDIICKVDNDAYFLTDGWLKEMVEIWKRNRRLALSCYVQGLKDNPGGASREAYGQIHGQVVGMSRHLGGICHFVDARAYKDWCWPEDDFLHGVQDLEFSQYLWGKEYQMAYLENFFVEHYEGTEGQHQRYPAYFERRKREKTTRYAKDE